MNRLFSTALILAALASGPTGLSAGIEFTREIQPLLARHCLECHGADLQKGKLRLDSKEAAFKGGAGGPAILPGNPSESELVHRISLPKGHDDIMPPRGEPLPSSQVTLIRKWIEQGAVWPDDAKPLKHWAYVKPIRPALPQVQNGSWPRNEIDRFILVRLEKEGLKHSAPADPARLLRRVYLDLTGLPPSPAEADAFLSNPTAEAYEKVVDRLLNSPQYGERWATPWLDLARYADSHGFQRDDLRDHWPYRDWVIRAINADMPFDQFSIEQIAGDLLPDATIDQKIATGFHRCAPTNVEAGTDQEEGRVNQVFDRVNTTGTVWLGTTLECAQCHDHKYDPFSQKEYYQLFAFFNNTEKETDFTSPKAMASLKFVGPYMSVPDPAQEARRKKLEAETGELDRRISSLTRSLLADQDKWESAVTSSAANAPQTHALDIAEFQSTGGSFHKILDDKSVLLGDSDAVPAKDTYTVKVHTRLTGITGFKLEALTDPSLPGKGPGRGDAQRPNFVLNTFKVEAASGSDGSKPRAIQLRSARASFSQKNYPVAGAIDNDPATAWGINPEFHKDHWAIFETLEPVSHPGGLTLTFTLEQNYGGGRTIGRLRLSALTGDPAAKPLPADITEILNLPKAKRSPAQAKRLSDFHLSENRELAALKEQRSKLETALKDQASPQTLVMKELEQPRMANLFMRGNFLEKGEPVQPDVPAVLHPLPSPAWNRLDLARWLVSRDNPLVARVTVNRWWMEFFGRGLVSTPEDFGIKGEPPAHPELLDWLAVEFMERGWSRKAIHKLIVMSATYRQSSRVTPELLEKDDQNKLYARGPRFRLDAETIRDNALAAAGLLSLKQGGPPVRPYQPPGLWESKVGGDRVTYDVSEGEDRHRRGLYTVWKRASPYPSFVNFDAAARTACVVERSRSNTPLQALTLLNDPVYVEAAMALAARVMKESPSQTIKDRVEYAFRLCLVRRPSETEAKALTALYEQQLAEYESNPKTAQTLLGRQTVPKGMTLPEFAAWYSVAAALLNLDEMITKG